ncbi:50S ribosomal protein L19 [Patescibacteria group bacterium]|nr:50S ribosomal protein L19 [Patescibacteria group bacterium]
MHPTIREAQKQQLKPLPEIKSGYTIRVHQKITEGNKERIQIFEGLVIKVGHGEGVEKTITVRKVVQGIGVEKIFPLHSPNIKKIEVKKKAKVRRSKLYYMRDRSGKSARLQERHVTDAERAIEDEKMEAMIEEAVQAEEKRKAEAAKAENPDTTEVSDDTAEPQGDAVEAQDPAPEIEEASAEPVADSEPAEPVADPKEEKPIS